MLEWKRMRDLEGKGDILSWKGRSQAIQGFVDQFKDLVLILKTEGRFERFK